MRIFKNAISHNGSRCDICYFDTNNLDDIPDELIIKAHAVCFWEKKMLLVNHSEWDIWGIPGGTRDKGESIKQTLAREILEETNCEIIDYEPIGYQKIIAENDNLSPLPHQLSFSCWYK